VKVPAVEQQSVLPMDPGIPAMRLLFVESMVKGENKITPCAGAIENTTRDKGNIYIPNRHKMLSYPLP
jgi:hypothetical protein